MQIGRLLEIVMILLRQEKTTAKDLAHQFGVSMRTIYRDIDVLSSAHIPVYMSKGTKGGISLLHEYSIDKRLVTEEEKEKVLLALHTLQATGFPSIESTISKIDSLFCTKNNYDWVEIDFSGFGVSPLMNTLFDQLKDSIMHRKVLSIHYQNAKGIESIREIDPLKLIFKSHCWYLVGFCHIRKQYRTFKLSRIRQIETIEQTFQTTLPKEYKIEEDTTSLLKLKLQFSSTLAYRVYDEFLENEITKDKDGNLFVHVEFPAGKWVQSYLLSFGSGVEVLEPINLRNELIQILDKTREVYK